METNTNTPPEPALSNKGAADRAPAALSPAAVAAWIECEQDTPFFFYRAIDKTCYEVGRRTNENWRECISEDRIIIGTFATEEDAQKIYDEHRIQWMWSEILKANPHAHQWKIKL